MQVIYVLSDGLVGKGGIARSMCTITETMQRETDVRADVFAMRRTSSMARWMIMLPVRVIQLAYKLLTDPCDVVHINISHGGSSLRKFIVWLVCKILGKPVILHLHSSTYRTFIRNISSRSARLLRWMFRNTDYVIVLGQGWAQFAVDVLTVPPERIRIVNNAVADPGVSVNLRVPVCNMLFLGAVGERKGMPELLNALAMPDLKNRAWHLTVAGNGDLEEFKDFVRNAGLDTRVHFEGWVDAPRVRELLLGSQILVLPSRAENQPLSVLEGMAYGLAVVATRVGAVPEVIEDRETGLLVDVQDEFGLAKALAELVDNEELRVKIGAAARAAYLQNHRPETQIMHLLQIYRELPAKQPGRA